MTVALGIDAGGTYTDAVLVDNATGQVLSSAKSLTTKRNLSVGINSVITATLNSRQRGLSPRQVTLVSLSTTLATNAIAEGHGAPVCLFLIGYDGQLIERYQLQQQLGAADIIYLDGGHELGGREHRPLDERAARLAIEQKRRKVSAFAVSGYFAALNPAHELRLRELIRQLSDLPVTCGHELSTRLDSIRRATTAALNARLIPLIQDLIAKVRHSLEELSIKAPLMVVKGDGSLVRAEWALQRPIETVLSGPAASAVGARQLAGEHDGLAVDVGGTTTDIVALKQGRPGVNQEGANIGGWRTMVAAVDVHTIGLGGDSHVRRDSEGRLRIGPQRVVPLCKLADEHPEILAELHRHPRKKIFEDAAGQFLLSLQAPGNQLPDKHRAVLDILQTGPQPLPRLLEKLYRRDPWISNRIDYLEKTHLIQRAAFTPTDALHVLKRFQRWNTQASVLGAELLSAQMGLSVKAFCRQTVQSVSKQLGIAIIGKMLEEDGAAPDWAKEPSARAFVERALAELPQGDFAYKITLRRPLVALGAPVAAFMPYTADKLHAKLNIPPHAEVAGAIGAISGNVLQQLSVKIRPLPGGRPLRLYLPDGSKDFTQLEQAVRYAKKSMLPRVEARALKAGAKQVELQIDRRDRHAKLRGHKDLYLGTELTFTAFGRPSPARNVGR